MRCVDPNSLTHTLFPVVQFEFFLILWYYYLVHGSIYFNLITICVMHIFAVVPHTFTHSLTSPCYGHSPRKKTVRMRWWTFSFFFVLFVFCLNLHEEKATRQKWERFSLISFWRRCCCFFLQQIHIIHLRFIGVKLNTRTLSPPDSSLRNHFSIPFQVELACCWFFSSPLSATMVLLRQCLSLRLVNSHDRQWKWFQRIRKKIRPFIEAISIWSKYKLN